MALSKISLTGNGIENTLPVANGGTAVTTAAALANLGNLVKLSSVVASDTTDIVFDNTLITDTYDTYMLTFRDIDLRESYGVGLGNRNEEFLNFKTTYELGFSNVKTKHNLISNKNFNAGIWLLNLEKSFSTFNLKFFHKNNGIQEINGNNQLIVKSNTGLKLPILRNIYLSYELQVDWEKKPSSNKKKTDKINYFTLGYEW